MPNTVNNNICQSLMLAYITFNSNDKSISYVLSDVFNVCIDVLLNINQTETNRPTKTYERDGDLLVVKTDRRTGIKTGV